MSAKTNIVLVHGAWADGSSWSKVIPPLEKQSYTVTAAQLPLTSLSEDIAVTRRILSMQKGPTVLVGHSYGGDPEALERQVLHGEVRACSVETPSFLVSDFRERSDDSAESAGIYGATHGRYNPHGACEPRIDGLPPERRCRDHRARRERLGLGN